MRTPQHVTAGLTLTEVVVAMACFALVSAVTFASLPDPNRPVDVATLPDRVATTLEASWTQATSERTPVTVTGQGDTLTIRDAIGTDHLQVPAATLSGTLTIQPGGETAGALQVLGPGVPCQQLSLTSTGTDQRGSCGAVPAAPESPPAAPPPTAPTAPVILDPPAPSPGLPKLPEVTPPPPSIDPLPRPGEEAY